MADLSATWPGLTARTAPSPFNKASADIVLRSSDGVDFRVRSAILSEVSPFFEDMFGLPQSDTDSSRLDPIQMEENSRTLQILLQLCYPLVDRVPKSLRLEEARAVLEAAIKYDMDTAKELMRRSLMGFAKTQPLRVYAIACVHKLVPEAKRAAEEAVKQDVAFGHYAKEFEEMPAGCYYRLQQFRKRSGSNATKDFTFFPEDRNVSTNESGASEHALRDAASPFDRPDADVIIVSQDRVRFRVHSQVLTVASSVFSSMLAKPQPHYPHQIFELDAKAQGLAHYLILSEASAVLRTMLGLCYYSGLQDTVLEDRNMRSCLMHAAVKYSLQHIIRALKVDLSNSLGSQPLQAFALAILYGWTDVAKSAAAALLRLEMTELQSTYDPILEQISSGPYIRLLDYHRECGIAAGGVALRHAQLLAQETSNWRKRHCNDCHLTYGPTLIAANRLDKYMTTAKISLVDKPHASALSEGAPHRQFVLMSAVGCTICEDERVNMAETLNSAFKAAIDKATSDVVFQLAPQPWLVS